MEYIKKYKLKLTFDNKDVKIVDLEEELWGPMFEPLKDIEYFKKVKTDGHTIVWPNEVDFCPDFLYQMGKKISKQTHKRKSVTKFISEKSRTQIAAKSKH